MGCRRLCLAWSVPDVPLRQRLKRSKRLYVSDRSNETTEKSQRCHSCFPPTFHARTTFYHLPYTQALPTFPPRCPLPRTRCAPSTQLCACVCHWPRERSAHTSSAFGSAGPQPILLYSALIQYIYTPLIGHGLYTLYSISSAFGSAGPQPGWRSGRRTRL